MSWFRERELRQVLQQHAREQDTEIGAVEATGAINFLVLDDLPVGQEGKPLDPRSVMRLPFHEGRPRFPPIADYLTRRAGFVGDHHPLLTGRGQPMQQIIRHRGRAPHFIRTALFQPETFDPHAFCHQPLVVRDPHRPLGQVLHRLTVRPKQPDSDVIDKNLILVWTDEQQRIITGSDLLGRLLRSIARSE